MQEIFRTLPRLLRELDADTELREAMIFAVWRRIAGSGLAEHAIPVCLEGPRLRIAVADRNWKRQLESLSGQMLFKLNAAVGTPSVSYIDFEIDPSVFLRMPTKEPQPDTDGIQIAGHEIGLSAQGIDDP
ncbi:MAG: DUF721 domain-containing protein, partial [Acidobacteriota bacterium]